MDASAKGFYAVQISVSDCLAMIEKPVQALERSFTIYFLEDVQETCDAFIVGGMQPERPFVGGKQRDDVFKLALQRCVEIGPRFKEVLEVRCREYEHFAGAVAAEEIIAVARPRHLD